MRTMTALVVGLALALAVSGCSQKTGVAAAADAMGATNLNTIQFSGSGTNYAFGQAYQPGGAWPRFEVKTYSRGRGLSGARDEGRDAARAR